MKKKPKVFLGGTCNGSTWRDELIPRLTIDYFNPVVDDWNKEAQEEEERQKEICDILLYVITPKMRGVYSVAEVVDSSNKKPKATLLMIQQSEDGIFFDEGQHRSLSAVCDMVDANGALVAFTWMDLIKKLNNWGNDD